MKFCINCIHHQEVTVFPYTVIGCDKKKYVDLTDGKPLVMQASKERASSDEDRCGPEGKFFEKIGGPGED